MSQDTTCRCGNALGAGPLEEDPIAEGWCAACQDRFGPHGLKALVDPFDYALCLMDGTVIRFEQLEWAGREWVLVAGVKTDPDDYRGPAGRQRLAYGCPRGVQVRVAAIAWIADAPEGS